MAPIRIETATLLNAVSINTGQTSAYAPTHGMNQLMLEIDYTYSAATSWSFQIEQGDGTTARILAHEEEGASGTRNIYARTYKYTTGGADINLALPIQILAEQFRIKNFLAVGGDASDVVTVRLLKAAV